MTQWYGVSSGNGNDGVSHLYPDYYVQTDAPWVLAHAALLGCIKSKWHDWADDAMVIDGEEEFGISATLHEGPDGETEFSAAWLIVEVFPVDEPEGRAPQYDSLDDALSADVVALARAAETT